MLEKLSVRRLVLLAAYVVTVVAYGTAVACLLLVSLTATVWIVNITTVFYFVVVRTLDRRYNRAFARANLTMSCGQLLDGVQVTDKGTLTREDIQARGLFPVPAEGKGLVCGMSVTGRDGAVRIHMCELTVYYDILSPKKKLGLLNGLWMEVRLPADTGLCLTLIQHNVLDSETAATFYAEQGMDKLPIWEDALRDGFALYGDKPSAKLAARLARRCVPLVQQMEKGGGRLLLSLRGDMLCAFLTGRSLTFSTPIRGRLTPEVVGWNRLPELKLLLALGRDSLPRKSSR